MPEMLALKLFTVANLHYELVDSTKLLCDTLPPMQHHSFLRNLTPLTSKELAENEEN